MIINVASFGGRSHMLDLARELVNCGHEVRFYSYLRGHDAKMYGLERKYNYSLFYFGLPFLFFFKFFDLLKLPKYRRYSYYLYKRVFDFFTAYYMKPCDVFIGQSPMHFYSLKKAKSRFNAITILERGTSHVYVQRQALNENPILNGKDAMPNPYFKYDLKGYQFADYISVGSQHVKDSFLINGFEENRIFVNNYGFDYKEFFPTKLIEDHFDIIFVGQWCFRKGCDILIDACEFGGFTLLHVGKIGDVSFPISPRFKHFDSVSQNELLNYYSRAKIFVLPSREEGLALVQAQALACGLPIVCSPKSGGIDLRKFILEDKWIIEMNDFKVNTLIDCIKEALSLSDSQVGLRSYVGNDFSSISWKGYGSRYNKFLKSLNSN